MQFQIHPDTQARLAMFTAVLDEPEARQNPTDAAGDTFFPPSDDSSLDGSELAPSAVA